MYEGEGNEESFFVTRSLNHMLKLFFTPVCRGEVQGRKICPVF